MKLDKLLISLGFSLSSLFSQNLNYAVHDIHTLTIPKNQFNFSYDYMLMNDTVDILNIKESEFGNSTKYDAIGDLNGHNIKLRYGILDNLMIGVKFKKEDIQYSSNTLTNTNVDTYMRYNIFNHKNTTLNSGLSFDIGYVSNKLDDFYLRNESEIDSLGDKVIQEKGIIKQITDNTDPILSNGDYYIFNNETADPNDKIKLDNNSFSALRNGLSVSDMWIALKNVSDESHYIRLLTGFYDKKQAIDFYIGFKKTKIKGVITANDEILDYASSIGEDIEVKLDRSESMYMIGMNYTLESKNFIYEFGFEYDKFIRDDSLSYVNFNYILDLDISYKYNKNTLL
ncbi:MAG: hypothetical protein U9N59_11275, partial [Campylobacterota bacterium]|nr:hypothetical protein [Campylobacterota bacterium]